LLRATPAEFCGWLLRSETRECNSSIVIGPFPGSFEPGIFLVEILERDAAR
jgi:hypothetical protein